MKVWLLAASFLLASVTQAQDYERERRWAAEFVPSLVVGDAVRIALPPRNFLGIHAEGKPGKPAILLVHGLGVHPDHGVIGILRTLLVDAGYTTLSIQMPVQGAQATADDYPALFAEAAARIQAAAGWLAAKEHARPVLLSHSMGSRMAMAYYERAAGAPFAAWISLGITADYGAITKVGAPVLDVYGEKDFPQVLRANPVRRMAVSGIAGSKQVMIPDADHYYTGREKALASAIEEFLQESQRLPAAALAQTPNCRILNYGIFTEVETYQSREAPATAGGKEMLAHPHAAIERTTRVPARLGVMFGVVHDFDNIPAGGFIAALVRHPPLPAAGGGTKTESLLRKEPESAATGFRFDRPDEIARGDWSFEFQYQENVLCRQNFTVE